MQTARVNLVEHRVRPLPQLRPQSLAAQGGIRRVLEEEAHRVSERCRLPGGEAGSKGVAIELRKIRGELEQRIVGCAEVVLQGAELEPAFFGDGTHG